MYNIHETKLLSFLNEPYDLPRYQRKETWGYSRNFELAISVFQNYPVGVLIVEKKDVPREDGSGVDTSYWLLDGRQRKVALTAMVYNPTELYSWARRYLKFNQSCNESKVRNNFNYEMQIFLEKEDEEEGENPLKEEEGEATEDNKYSEEDSEELIEPEDTGKEDGNNVVPVISKLYDLDALLDLILMVHNVPSSFKRVEGKGGPTNKKFKIWESLFDFRHDFIGLNDRKNKGFFDYRKHDYPLVVSAMPYWDEIKDEIDLRDLRKFILGYAASYGKDNTPENFVEYCKNSRNFKIVDIEYFKRIVDNLWPNIKASVNVVNRTENIFRDTKIGEIFLTNVSPFDSLTIFSRVNSNGVPLKAEELLSAKPFWNKEVKKSLSEGVEGNVKKLYTDALKIKHDGKIVRWDIGATLIDRLGDTFIFHEDKEKGNFMGFKLLSSFYCGGMAKTELAELETRANEEKVWYGKNRTGVAEEKEDVHVPKIDTLIVELRELICTLSSFKFFKRFARGKMPISRLLGSAPAFEFITIMWRAWKNPNRGERKKDVDLEREAVRLFDKLVYETVNGAWGNAGDSTMKLHIREWRSRISNSQPFADWEELIEKAAGEKYEMATGKYADMAPILYYFEALKEDGFPLFLQADIDIEGYDVDHILPQVAFGDSSNYNKDCLANLSLLHPSHNVRKADKTLSKLDDLNLKKAVAAASGIPIEQFEEYSSFKTFEEFVNARTGYLLDFIRVKRKSLTED